MKKGSFKFICVGLCALLLTLLTPYIVLGQAPPLSEVEGVLAESAALLQPSVNGVVYQPVHLDGIRLFEIAAVAANQPGGGNGDPHLPLQGRTRQIETKLQNLVRNGFASDSLQVRVGKLNNQIVIVAADDAALDDTVLLTVTDLDTTLHGITPENLANQWTDIIEAGLLRAQQERQPEHLRQQGLLAAGLGLTVICLSLAIWQLQRRYQRQWQALEQALAADALVAEVAHDKDANDNGDRSQPSPATQLNGGDLTQEQKFSDITSDLTEVAIAASAAESAAAAATALDWRVMRQQRIAFHKLLLQWLQVTLWIGGISTGLILFPLTRGAGYWLLLRPLSILLIWLLVAVANRLSIIVIERHIQAWANRYLLRSSTSYRKARRLPTFTRALTGLVTCLLIALGILLTMDDLGIPLGPLLAGASILGFAITWSFQNLMKDVSMGALILLEDQFAVGDVVVIGDLDGTVETMNLRSTQLRHGSGQLITISNSMITSVRNLSKDWARVNLSVPIPYDSDMLKAMQLILQVAEAMHDDPDWQDLMLDAPQVLGIDGFDPSGVAVRVLIKTQPLKQWDVEREFRCRLKLALDNHGIPIGVPQQEIWVRGATSEPLLTPNGANQSGTNQRGEH